MGAILRMAALAAAIAAVGVVTPADAKPKHGQEHYVSRHHAPMHNGYGHASRHYSGYGHRYSGSSMAPGWRGWYGGERPPGWSHGAKRGWNGRHVPPEHQRGYYYR